MARVEFPCDGLAWLVSVRWVVDARTGRVIDLDLFCTAERLGLYEAIRHAAAAVRRA